MNLGLHHLNDPRLQELVGESRAFYAQRGAAGVLPQIHGGGFSLGSAAGEDRSNRDLADALGLAVVSVDYRRAPEHPWPAAPEDCEVAALWLAEHAQDRFGADVGVDG